MRFLLMVWEDVKRGENIDLYATVVVAVVIAVLNILGLAPATLVGPITLGVLALFAVSSVLSRRQIERLDKNLSRTTEPFFMDEFPPTLKTDLSKAKDIWLVGVTLTQVTRNNYAAIEEALRRGSSVRILVVQPESPTLDMAEARSYTKPNVERLGREIRGTLEDYDQFRISFPSKVEIRTIKHPLGHGIMGFDVDLPTGVLYMSVYPFRTPGGSRPKFVLRASDGRWFDFFRSELGNLWKQAEVWSGNAPTAAIASSGSASPPTASAPGDP